MRAFLFHFFWNGSFSCPFLTVSFSFPPFLFHHCSVSFHISDEGRRRELGAGSREGAGRTEGFHRNPRTTLVNTVEPVTTTVHFFMWFGRVWGGFCLNWKPHRFFSVSKTFLYRFFTVSLPFPYRFFTVSVFVSFPFPLPFLFRFFSKKETIKKRSQRFLWH